MINLFLWRSVILIGGSLDIYSVFVSSGQKKGVESPLLLIPLNHVGDDCCVQMPKVRQAVGVIDRSCNVKSSTHYEIASKLTVFILYFENIGSAVRIGISSIFDCETRRRSNGSLCIAGKE